MFLKTKNSPGCLGFAPRSNSFAIEPSVQVCSIFSLSGRAIFPPSVKEQPVQEYLTDSSGILGQINLAFKRSKFIFLECIVNFFLMKIAKKIITVLYIHVTQ